MNANAPENGNGIEGLASTYIELALELVTLWIGSPQERAQVIPRIAEFQRFTGILVVVLMIEHLQHAPSGDDSIPRLLKALENAVWQYA